jgi:hypothetical protein
MVAGRDRAYPLGVVAIDDPAHRRAEARSLVRAFFDRIAENAEGIDFARLVSRALDRPAQSTDELVCAVIIDGPEAVTFQIAMTPAGLDLRERPCEAPRASLRLTADQLKEIILGSGDKHDDLRQRMDLLASLGVTGDFRLVFFLGSLFMRNPSSAAETYAAIERRARELGRRELASVERVEKPSPERVLEAWSTSTPIVATGCLDHVDAVRWTADDLRARFGDVRVFTRSGMRTIGDFLDGLRDRDGYTGGGPLPSELLEPFPRVLSAPRGQPDAALLWLGAQTKPGCITSCHRDPDHGVVLQIWGRKRFRLFSPEQTEQLYLRDNRWSEVDMDRPDLDRHPAFADAKSIEVEIGPGEVLLNPAGWFHAVWPIDRVVFSITYFA